MDNKKYNLRSTLIYIGKNPGCNTNPEFIDGNLVHDLYKRELVDGSHSRHFQSTEHEYTNLRITEDGKSYLDNLNNDEVKLIQNWYNRPIGIVILGIAVVVIGAFLLKMLGLSP